MENQVIFQDRQQLSVIDANRLGEFATDSIDRVVREGIDPGLRFTGFNVAEASVAATVVVGAGAVYSDGKVYARNDEGGVEINLISLLPVLTKKIVTIMAWGQEIDTEVEPRTFVIDAVTRTTEARAIPTVKRRFANVDKAAGSESSDPQSPGIDAGVVPVAYVLLSPAGIVSITRANDYVLVSGRDNADAIAENKVWRAQIGSKIETLQSDITGLSSRLKGTARVENIVELSRDVAVLKTTAGLPDDHASYGYEPFLTLAQSDTDAFVVTGSASHPALNCAVEEGIRFAPSAVAYSQLSLLNADESRVKQQNTFIMPTFTEVARITSKDKSDEISLSQYENQTVNMVQKSATRQRVRYGSYRRVCTNNAFWKSGTYNPTTGIFTRNGETFTVDIDPNQGTNGFTPNHYFARLRQFWVDTYQEPYWAAQTSTVSVNGSVIGQTFLNSQETWLTGLGLYFTRKGNANVTVAICETTENGAPNPKKIVAQTTLAVADIQLYPLETKAVFDPTLLERGKRYAIVPITTGSHYLAISTTGKFNQGSLFYSTDQNWFQGDLLKDLCFVLYAAKFDTPRVEVQLQALLLAEGITDIDINADVVIPTGCTLGYEVKINNVWVPFGSYDVDMLASAPPELQLRAVFQGTTDLMPRLGIGSRSQAKVQRPKTSLTHVSTGHTPPVPVNTVWVEERYEGWDPAASHAATCKLLTGTGYATVKDPNTTEIITMPGEGTDVVVRRYIYTFGSPIASFKIRTDGSTGTINSCFHVAFRQYISLNS